MNNKDARPRTAVRTLVAPRWRPLLIGLLLLAACVALRPVAFAQGASPADLSGKVTHGSSQGGSAGGLTVVLQELDATGTEVSRLETSAGADGAFTFEGVTPKPGHLYRPIVEYADVRYYGDGYLAEEIAGKPLDITVYETTATPDNIRFVRQTTVILEADEKAGMLRVLESSVLANTGDTTFIGQEDGSGQLITVMIPLPPLALDVQPGFGFSSQGFLQAQGAIADIQPLPPGQREMIYSYSVAYVASQHSFGRAYPYPVDVVRVLVPDSGMIVQPDGLEPGDPVTISTMTYRSYTVTDVQPGARVGIQLQKLPVSQGVRSRDLLEMLRWGALSAVVLALLGVVGLYLWRRRTRGLQAAPATIAPSPREALVERMAEIEEAHRAGRLTDDEYQRQRSQLRENLQHLLAGEGG